VVSRNIHFFPYLSPFRSPH